MGTCLLSRTYISHRRLSRTPPKTTTTPSHRSSSLKGGVLSRDTSMTPYIHATYFPPVSTTICYKFHRNLPQVPLQFAAICRFCQILPQFTVSAKFYQVCRIPPKPRQCTVQYR